MRRLTDEQLDLAERLADNDTARAQGERRVMEPHDCNFHDEIQRCITTIDAHNRISGKVRK